MLKTWFRDNITIIILREILETSKLMREFMDLRQTIEMFYHNHGEDKRLLIQQTVFTTHLGNGLISQHLLLKVTIITTTIIKTKTLETRRSMKEYMDLHLTTEMFYHNHGEDKR